MNMIEKYLREKYENYLDGLDIYENSTSLILSRIIIKPEFRSTGVGSKIMDEIIQYADKNKQIVALTPASDFGGNKNRLIQFYKRFDFKPNKGQYKHFGFKDDMIRYPKLNETKQIIKKLLRESLIKENYVDKALENLSRVGEFDKLNAVDKLILLGAAGDEEKTKKINLKDIYQVNNTFGKRLVKVRVKPVEQQPIKHRFSQQMAGEVGWLTNYIHYSEEGKPYNTVYFDEIEYHNEVDSSFKSMPIMLDNVYPIDYGDEPKHFTKHDIEREISRIEYLKNMGMDPDDSPF
jgi:predicted GNAT family acetyltransferase